MKLLKLKAKIYQYTGIYLAQKEELKMLKSKSFWQEFCRLQETFADMRELQSFMIGDWQSRKGFTRYVSKFGMRSKFNPFYLNILICLDQFYAAAKYDLKDLFKKTK